MSATIPPVEYAPASTAAAAAGLRERYGLFIGADWCEAAGGAYVAIDPAGETRLAEIARANVEDVERAVRAARRGYEKYWRKLRPSERAKYLFRFARAVDERSRELAVVEALDAGTPVRRAREHDVPQAVATLFHHAGWADKLSWALQAGERPRALGVVAAVAGAPAPSLAAALQIAPALACGNAVVLLAPEHAPLASLVLAQAALDSDLPPGVLCVLSGDARTRTALCEHADVDGIAFAGPRAAAAAVAKSVAGTNKRLALRVEEPGLTLIYEDAPLEQAVEGFVRSAFVEKGPFASAGLRLLVQESVRDAVLAEIGARLTVLRQGDPLDENTECGPLLTREARDAALAFAQAAVEDGALLLQSAAALPERGFWYPATLLRDVQPAQRGALAAPCPPVVAALSFRTVDESLERAAAFGPCRGVGVWTSSGQLAAYVARRVHAGSVWCNAFDRYDPGAYDRGPAGLRAFLQT